MKYDVHARLVLLNSLLRYWDWSLDWEDITLAPIWDPDTGFGGNGSPTEGEEILDGHCVVDGPFANTSIGFLDDEAHPHCLSRGFESGEDLLNHGRWFNPAALEKLFQHSDYTAFNLGLENGPHNAIPRSIRGDFLLLTAPYGELPIRGQLICTWLIDYLDPVFFLHHTQLDRLWWIWQHYEPSRLRKYTGDAYHNATESASLDDVLSVGGLGPDVRVSDIIDSESGHLCYRY